MFSLGRPASLLAFTYSSVVLAQSCSIPCRSFGLDYMDGGRYFQNINSTAPFTAFQDFRGCQNDVANNILVDPTGAQYDCSETPMQPDNSQTTVTCPIQQNQLTSGQWSIIVLSNNGQCDSINFIRRFSLSVGTQATTSVATTVTVATTSTPVSVTILTTSSTITSTVRASTTTVAGTAPPQTVTSKPGPKITFVTKGVATITSTSTTAAIVATQTITVTRNCAFRALATPQANGASPNAPNGRVADRVNSKIVVTVGEMAGTKPTPAVKARSGSTKAKQGVSEQRAARRQEQIIQVRSLEKRHPDQPTVTVINTALPPVVSTVTSVAPTLTVTGTSTKLVTKTVTPIITVTGKQPVVTVTRPGITITNFIWIPVEFATATTTLPLTATFTSTACA